MTRDFFLNTIKTFSFLALLTPIIFSGRFFFPFVGPKSLFFMGISEVIIFSYLALIFIDKKYLPTLNPLLIFLLIYLFVFILSSFLGVDLAYSFWSKHERMTGILMHLHLFGFFLVLSSTMKKEDFKNLFLASILVSFCVGLIGVLAARVSMMRGGGTIGNESFLGTYLLFNIFFALYLFFDSLDWKKSFGLVFFFLLSILLLLVGITFQEGTAKDILFAIFFKSGARAAKISLYGALGFLALIYFLRKKQKIVSFSAGFILLVSFIVFSFVFYSICFEPKSFFRQLLEKEVGSFGGRFYVWEIAKKAFFERPLFGFGPENFEFAFLKYYNPCFGTPECGFDLWYDRAHNVIFDTLSTTGIFGLISYFLLLLSCFFVLWKSYLNKKINFWVAGVFTALLLAYFVQNLTVFDMISSYLMLFLTLAFVASFEKKEKVSKVKDLNFGVFSLIFISFLASFSFFVLLPTVSSASVISSLKADSTQRKIELERFTINLSPLGRKQIRQFFAENFSSRIIRTQKIEKEDLVEVEFLTKELQKNIQENPLDFRSYYLIGNILTISSQPDNLKKGEEILRKAIELWPNNQKAYWALAQNLLLQKRFDEAISLAQKAVDLEPKLKDSHLILIQILKITQRYDLIEEATKRALSIDPGWESEIQQILSTS